MCTVPLVGHRVGSWFNLTRTMIIPFYGTCKSTINWVIEIPLRVNPIRRENQHLSENISVSAARLELVLLITKPGYIGREREM